MPSRSAPTRIWPAAEPRNRKTFGLLIRAAGLGQYKEGNGWPVAMMRRRFKCMRGENETDTDKISDEGCDKPGIGG